VQQGVLRLRRLEARVELRLVRREGRRHVGGEYGGWGEEVRS
jgi:hypothetical protein